MKITKNEITALSLFNELRERYKKQEPISGIRGSPDARRLLIAHPCDESEYNTTKVPFSNAASYVLHNLMLNAGIDTDKDFLVVSASLFGLKHNKASCEPMRNFIIQCAKLELFDFYLCVGSEAFKHIFGGGKKPSVVTLTGNVLYTAETQHMPTYTLPSIEPLVYTEGEDDRQNWGMKRAAEDLRVLLERLILKMKTTPEYDK